MAVLYYGVVMDKISGIYEIRNKINGHKYYGSAVDIKRRFRRHIKDLNNGGHHSVALQRAWNKYGASEFDFHVLCECLPNKKDLLELEQSYLDQNPEYNIAKMAGSSLGVIKSDETKRKISEKLMGHKYPPITEENRINRRNGQLGKHPSPETIKKMQDSHKGSRKPRTEETKAKISMGGIGKHNRSHTEDEKIKIGNSNKGKHFGNIGRKHTKEEIDKMRLSHIGKNTGPMSDETKRKLSEALSGVNKGIKHGPMSDETKRKLSEAHKGIKHGPMPDETRRKISETKLKNRISPKVDIDNVNE